MISRRRFLKLAGGAAARAASVGLLTAFSYGEETTTAAALGLDEGTPEA